MLATVLIINKSIMRTFSIRINKFTSSFNWLTITSKIRNRVTKLETGLVTLNVLTSWLILLTLRALLERTSLLTVDDLTSWLTLLTLQTLSPVLLEQTVLLTFNGLVTKLIGKLHFLCSISMQNGKRWM